MSDELATIDDELARGAITATAPQLVPLASPSCGQVCAALAIAQGEFKTPRRTKQATIKGTGYSYAYAYAPLEEIVDAVKEALARNGLARHQYLVSRGGQPVMRTIIWHASGEWIASDYPIHPTKEGAQGFASGVTYARRYGLSLALGLAPEDDDDANVADGNLAEGKDRMPIRRPQARPLPDHKIEPPVNPETGEIGPHAIPVGLTKTGDPDWIGWGSKFVAAVGTGSADEAMTWINCCRDALGNCERDAPKVYQRIAANVPKVYERIAAE